MTIAQNSQTPQLSLMPNEIRQNLGESVYVLCNPIVPNTELISNIEWRNPRGERIEPGEDLP